MRKTKQQIRNNKLSNAELDHISTFFCSLIEIYEYNYHSDFGVMHRIKFKEGNYTKYTLNELSKFMGSVNISFRNKWITIKFDE